MYLQLNMVIFHCHISFLEGFLVESGQEADINSDGTSDFFLMKASCWPLASWKKGNHPTWRIIPGLVSG